MTEYELNDDLKDAVQKMLSNKKLTDFNPVREFEIGVLSVFCIRTDKDGEYVPCKGKPITCRKLSPPLQLITGSHYLLIADYGYWDGANERDRNAKLYHALMHINVEKNEEKNKLTVGTRKPEVQVFGKELALFGPHTLELQDVQQILQSSANKFAENVKATD